MEQANSIGIIGCGNMGEAIANGIISSNVIAGRNLYLYDIDKEKSNYLKDRLHANVTSSNEELVNDCSTILIAVKPQDIKDLLGGIGHLLDSSKFLISIAAGVTIKKIIGSLQEEVRIARVMPNIAALENQSISALCYNDYINPEDKDLAEKIFVSIGDIVEVEEAQMDAVTAISGSGPAYFFYLTEILEKCAIDMGIDKNKARLLAIKTFFGSATLLKNSDLSTEALRKRVTSKGGTTEAAFKVFQDKKLGKILQEGIKQAKERAKELSEGG